MTPEERTIHLENSIEIDAPLDVVIAFIDDPCKEFLWQPWLRTARKSAPFSSPGMKVLYVNHFAGKNFVNEYEIDTFEANGTHTYHSTPAAEVQATGANIFEALGPDRTRVTMIFDPEVLGFYWYMSDKKTERLYRKTLNKQGQRLKQAIEAGDYEAELVKAGVQRLETDEHRLCWIGELATTWDESRGSAQMQ